MSSTTKFVNEFCDIIDSYGGRDKVSISYPKCNWIKM